MTTALQAGRRIRALNQAERYAKMASIAAAVSVALAVLALALLVLR